MKKQLLFLILLLVSMSTGCWDTKEIDELALVTAMGIDKINDQYVLTTQIVNPTTIASQKGGGNQAPVVTYITKGRSITEALQKRSALGSRENYTSQLKILIIGENLAREGLSGIMDYLSRDTRMEPTFFIAVAKGTTAEKVLKVLTPLEKSPADAIYSSITTQAETNGTVLATRTDDLIANLINEGEEAKLTGIEIIGEKDKGNVEDNVKKINPDALLKTSNISVFRKDKMAGWLSEDATKGLIILLNKAKTVHFSITCPKDPEHYIEIEMRSNKTYLHGVLINNKPKMMIKMNADVNVKEVQCENIQIANPSSIHIIQDLTEKKLKRLVETAIFASQKKYKTDVMEFGRTIYRTQPQYWKQNKQNWETEFLSMPVEIHNQVNVFYTGTINDSMIKNIKE